MSWRSEILDGELSAELVDRQLRGAFCEELTIGIVANLIADQALNGPLDTDAFKEILRKFARERAANASGWVHGAIVEALEAHPAEADKVCGRPSCRATWKCRACGRMVCEHRCSLKTKDGAATCGRCKQ